MKEELLNKELEKKSSFLSKLNFEYKIIGLGIISLLLTYIFYFSGRIGILALIKGVFLGTFGFVVIVIPVVMGYYTFTSFKTKSFEVNVVKVVYFILGSLSLSMLISSIVFNGDVSAVDSFYKGYEAGNYLTLGFIATGVANFVTKVVGQGIAIMLFMMLTMFLVFFGFEKDFKEVIGLGKGWFNKILKVEEEDYQEFYNTKKHKLEDIEKRYNEELKEQEELREQELAEEKANQEKLELEKLEIERQERERLEQEQKLEREQREQSRREQQEREKLELEQQEEKLREYRFARSEELKNRKHSNSNQGPNVDEEDGIMKNENQEGEILNKEYVRYMREKEARKEQALREALDGKFAKDNPKSKYVQKNKNLKGRDLRPMPKPKVFKVEPREDGYENSEDNSNKIVFNRDIFDVRQQGIKLYELATEEQQSREFEISYEETRKINEKLFNDSMQDAEFNDNLIDNSNDNSFIDNYINAESAIRWVKGQNAENQYYDDVASNNTQNNNFETPQNNDVNQPQTNINVNINIDTNEELRRKQEKYLARTAVLDEVYNKVKHEIIDYFNDSTRDNFDFTKKPRVNSNNVGVNNEVEAETQPETQPTAQTVEFTPNFIMQDPVKEEQKEEQKEEYKSEYNAPQTSVIGTTAGINSGNEISSGLEHNANNNLTQIENSATNIVVPTKSSHLTMASTDELRTYPTNMESNRAFNNSPSNEFAGDYNGSNFDDVSQEITEELKEEIKGEVKEKILKEFAERIFENMSQEDKEEFLLGMRKSETGSENTTSTSVVNNSVNSDTNNTYRNYENAKTQGFGQPNTNSNINLGQPLNIQKTVDENDIKVYNINSRVENDNNANPNNQNTSLNTNNDDDVKVYNNLNNINRNITLQHQNEPQKKFHDEMGYEYDKKVEGYRADFNSINDLDKLDDLDDLYDDLALEDMYNEDEVDFDEIEKEYIEYASNVGHRDNNFNSNQNTSQYQNSTTKPGLKHIDTVATRNKPYEYPSVDILAKNTTPSTKMTDEEIKTNSELLEQTLSSFGVKVKVLNVTQGPTVTRYELQPGIGVKVSKIVGLADDLALNLAAQGIRIEAPIPGKSAVGIEVPNAERENIFFRDILENDEFLNHKSKIAVTLGKDISGKPVVADIGSMPHLLVAGATGSGKSVCINTLITSILYRATPEECKLLMIDPKVVELSIYNGIPHLMIPVVTDPKKACAALQWAVSEMEKRYEYFAEVSVRNLDGYNQYVKDNNMGETLPKVVIIVDELADLMMTAGKEVEESICRLTQKARAAGIHLIVATQRPSVDVITGLIKANIPSRIAFSVSSGIDSRTILGEVGAEKLLGRGDMLFIPYGSNEQTRIQGAFISDKEVENIVAHLKETSVVTYDESIIEEITSGSGASKGISQEDADDLLNDAMDLFIERDKASISMLQTRFKVGYNRAARIIDTLESAGYIGEQDGSKGRKILISRSEWENIQG